MLHLRLFLPSSATQKKRGKEKKFLFQSSEEDCFVKKNKKTETFFPNSLDPLNTAHCFMIVCCIVQLQLDTYRYRYESGISLQGVHGMLAGQKKKLSLAL